MAVAVPAVELDAAKARTKRTAATIALVAVLGVALWTQRALIVGALAELRSLSMFALLVLVVLAAYERWSRADIVRRLLGDQMSMGDAVTVHDVGTAVSKGVPLGGALGTAMRWSIVRERGVAPARFATMLIAYGIATTLVSWLLPFAALSLDLTQRSADPTDLAILTGIAVVVCVSAAFWTLVLRSERLEGFAVRRIRSIWLRLSRRIPSLDQHDPAAGVADVRRELVAIVRSPWSLLGRTMAAQACGSIILLVALRSMGVGDELAPTEFFRIFFITHLLGTFAPTPGGVGVVEAGMTGALVAAGVDAKMALASVLVYRFLTYIVPIMFGALLYLVWRSSRSRAEKTTAAVACDHDRGCHDVFGGVRVGGDLIPSVTLAGHGPPIDTSFPLLSRAPD